MGYQTYTSDALDIVGAGTAVGARKIKIWDNLVISNNLTINGATTLSGTNSDTTTSSGQKLMVLNTTSNNIERVNITPDNLVTLSGTQTISGTKTLSGAATLSNTVTLSGTNTDTTTSSGQKLMVLNTTSNNIERVNITPDNLVTLSGTQTISGDKTFTGITRVLTQQNPGNNAKFSLTCSGIITFDSSNNLKWSNDVLIQSIDRSFLSLGYLRITCPTSGTITYYKTDNTTTTVTCTSSGIPMSPSSDWSALYYEITNGAGNTSSSSQFRLVDLLNSTYRVNDNWILLALVNKDNGNIVYWKRVIGEWYISDLHIEYSPLKKNKIEPYIECLNCNGTGYK